MSDLAQRHDSIERPILTGLERERHMDFIYSGAIDLRDGLAAAPTDDVLQKWTTEDMSGRLTLANFAEIVAIETHPSFHDSALLLDDQSAKSVETMEDTYRYLQFKLHARRMRMMADLVDTEVDRRLGEGSEEVSILDIGPGPFPLELLLKERWEDQEDKRDRVHVSAVDISAPLLTYGLKEGIIQTGYNNDAYDIAQQYSLEPTEADAKAQEESLVPSPNPDIVIAGEVIEHVPKALKFAEEELGVLLRLNRASIVGSVPNTLPYAALVDAARGTGAARELVRSMHDPAFGHVSHFQYASVKAMLTGDPDSGYYGLGYDEDKSFIASSGLVLQQGRYDYAIPEGITHPHLGHSLVFAGIYNSTH